VGGLGGGAADEHPVGIQTGGACDRGAHLTDPVQGSGPVRIVGEDDLDRGGLTIVAGTGRADTDDPVEVGGLGGGGPGRTRVGAVGVNVQGGGRDLAGTVGGGDHVTAGLGLGLGAESADEVVALLVSGQPGGEYHQHRQSTGEYRRRAPGDGVGDTVPDASGAAGGGLLDRRRSEQGAAEQQHHRGHEG